jgi:O-antigen/teichoic acid export membrane protein
VVNLSAVVVSFGMGAAFLHHAPETEDEERAAAVHFTLKLAFAWLWAVLLGGYAAAFTDGATRTALLVLTATTGGVELTETGRLILTRRVVHRRLALLDLVSVMAATLLALGLAWRDSGLWALLAVDVAVSVSSLLALYVWRPVWRPRLMWSAPIARYYLGFGRFVALGNALNIALEHVDDLWTGVYLGETALAFYSRAWTFARYPRNIIADPLTAVTAGTFSELKGDRLRLSQAFFRTSALLVRSGFYLAGLLYLLGPEFIRLAIGEKWLPMMAAFRLMLVYALLVPLEKTVTKVFASVGRPEPIVHVRLVQLGVLVIGLLVLGPRLGTAGVALAVDLMAVLGMAILLWLVRTHVDLSPWRLFAVPTLALVTGLLLGTAAAAFPGVPGSDWRTGLAKLAVFSGVYWMVLVILEYRQLREMVLFALSHWRTSKMPAPTVETM